MIRAFLTLSAAFLLLQPCLAQSGPPLLFDMSRLQHRPTEVTAKSNNAKVPAGTVQLVDGQFGKACQFSFVESTGPQFFTAWVNPKEKWDEYAGFSFWVKGDGSQNFGGLEFIDGQDYALRYGYCFPIESKDWAKITVAWSDLIPELASPPVDAVQGFAPSRFRNLWIGKWHYWREFPACSFAIERMALEKTIERGPTEVPVQPGMPRLLAKLKARQNVTMVTMGDSLTDKRHWANREKLWAELLAGKLKETYGSEVTLVNPAIGGTTLSQNTVLIPRWLRQAPSPDLVLIWFGGNDWDSGVRGSRFKEYLAMTVDQVRRATKGRAEILLMTTCPGFGRWETYNELCQAAFQVAQQRRTGFADPARAFHAAGSPEVAMQREYWAWDKVHLGSAGHDLLTQTVLAAIASEGLADLKTAAESKWSKSPIGAPLGEGETQLWGFEPGQEELLNKGTAAVVQEHATEGKHALRLASLEKDYAVLSAEDGRSLRPIRENSRLLVDVFNPQDKEVALEVSVRDPRSTDYNTRYNGTVNIAPGKSTIDFDYTHLARSGSPKQTPDEIDRSQITLLVLFLGPHGDSRPVMLYLDNVRVARAAAPKKKAAAASTAPPSPTASQPAASQPPVSVSDDPAPKAAAATIEILSGFEPGGPDFVQGDGRLIQEHATQGRHAFHVQSDGQGYAGIHVTAPAALRKFPQYVVLKADVFNPQDEPVACGARVDDGLSKDYGSRYNDDGMVVRPGQSTIELNLTGLLKSNARNFSERQKVDLNTLKLVGIWIGPAGKPLSLYFDNIRLEPSMLPQVAGLKAFDFGPAGAPVYSGFEACTQQHVYSEDRGWGWIAPDHSSVTGMPDALSGDCVSGREFRVRVPNGSYEVQLCWDMFGLWGVQPTFHWRALSLNGREVIREELNDAEFYTRRYLAHEDDEDLPGDDLWDKYIASHQSIHRFTAEVTDGLLKIEPKADDRYGRGICFAVIYPAAVQVDGRRFVEQLTARRKSAFNAEMVVDVPKPTGAVPQPTAEEVQQGFIAFAAHTEQDLAVTARPSAANRGQPIVLAAARGERTSGQLGLYPLAEVSGVQVSAGELILASGSSGQPAGAANIPGIAVQVRKVRNFLKRQGSGRLGSLLPYILQDTGAVDLRPGLTRAFWLTVTVPDSAAPGKYSGSLRIAAGGRSVAVPIELTVYPFKLDPITDLTISVTGSTAGSFTFLRPELKPRWWEIAELVMKNQAEHGMNAITGGPSAVLKGVRNGQAEIDYTDMDRWLALAVKYGLTMPGDSYQGLDMAGVPNDHTKDVVARCEAAAREQFGVSYPELLKLVYGDVARHAKEKGWPPRVYYFLDEPRPEYGNVQSCAELIKIRTSACPDTLFSGYYSTGSGRDVYFETMPVSIAHIDALSLELVAKGRKQIWDYSGSRVRHDIGRWAYVAAKAGMNGFLRNGYMYVCSEPYFDYTDDEGSWSVVYPSRTGISDTVGWERTAQGVNDYRYLLTCERLIAEARRKDPNDPKLKAAEAYLRETVKNIAIESKDSARLSAAEYDAFRHELAEHIMRLTSR